MALPHAQPTTSSEEPAFADVWLTISGWVWMTYFAALAVLGGWLLS